MIVAITRPLARAFRRDLACILIETMIPIVCYSCVPTAVEAGEMIPAGVPELGLIASLGDVEKRGNTLTLRKAKAKPAKRATVIALALVPPHP